jgi:hypothetical protein
MMRIELSSMYYKVAKTGNIYIHSDLLVCICIHLSNGLSWTELPSRPQDAIMASIYSEGKHCMKEETEAQDGVGSPPSHVFLLLEPVLRMFIHSLKG